MADLLEAAAPGTAYRELDEEARIALLLKELKTARPLVSAFVDYSEETLSELAILRTAAEAYKVLQLGGQNLPALSAFHLADARTLQEWAAGLETPSDRTAFFLLGELVEMGPTEQIFSTPEKQETENYITGRFG